MTQKFSPTINEDRLIGGSKNFGFAKFAPSISDVVGDPVIYGTLQKMGSILYFGITMVGDTETVSSVFSPPVKSYMRDLGSGEVIVYRGVLFDTDVVYQNDDGTFTLNDDTVVGGVKRITGFYWVE